MKKILDGPSRRVGTIFQEMDTNFLEVANSILRIAFPEHNLLEYAETEITEPTLFDSYLVKENAASLWGLAVEKDNIIFWNGAAWELLPYKITEINQALQFYFFGADKISIAPINGLTASEVQAALAEITAALIVAEILAPTS